MHDATAGPSLLQAQAGHANMARHDRHVHHHHNYLHRRQNSDSPTQVASAVTEVTSTISMIQEVEVDSRGSTVGVQTVVDGSTLSPEPTATADSQSVSPSPPAASPPSPPSSGASPLSVPMTSVLPVPSTSPSIAIPLVDTALPSPTSSSPTSISQSFSTTLGPLASLTSAPFISSSRFPTLAVTANSTSSTRSEGLLLPLTASNRSSTALPLSFANSTSTVSSSSLSITSTSSLSTDLSTSTHQSSSTFVGGAAGSGATGAAESGGSNPTNSAAASPGGGSSGSKPTPTPVVVGSVFGSIAGVAVILFFLLFIIRWKRRRDAVLPLGSSPDPISGTRAAPGDPPSSGQMTERSLPFGIPAAFATLTGSKRASHAHSQTASSTAGSERGFYRVSGRKIASVLETGGDGYGGPAEHELHERSMSGGSFYRDSRGFYGGTGEPSSPLAQVSTERDSGIPIMRPSPARTPVTAQGPFEQPAPPPPTSSPRRPDALGRSHPSHDGSHASRFTESV